MMFAIKTSSLRNNYRETMCTGEILQNRRWHSVKE